MSDVVAPGGRLLTMAEAAAHFRISRRKFQDILKDIPVCHLEAGRKKLFDERAIAAIVEHLRVKPSGLRPNRPARKAPLGPSSQYTQEEVWPAASLGEADPGGSLKAGADAAFSLR